jgi:hypothetical protein
MPPHVRHNRCRSTTLAVLITGLALFATGSRVVAGEPSAELRRTVAQHVSELSSSLRSERTRAEQALLELGPPILELLPSSDETPDQATRIAVRQLRVKLERIAAEQSVQPSRVSLRGRLPISDIAARIQEQTGNILSVERLAEASRNLQIDVDFDQTPFWEALTQVCASAQLTWEAAAEGAAIELLDIEEDAAQRRVAVATGAFLVSVEPVAGQRGTLRASLQLQAEPRLWALFVRIADADFSAGIDEQSLSLYNPLAVTELPMTSRGPARFNVLFRAPEGPMTAIDLHGRATVHLAAAPTEARFTELKADRAVYLRHGGVSVTLKQTKITTIPDQTRDLTVRLSVAYDAGGPEFESHRTWIYHNEVRLETPAGVRTPADSSFDTTRQMDGGVELEYRFRDLTAAELQDCELVYVAPTLLIDVPVEFAFENVPAAESRDERRESSDESR